MRRSLRSSLSLALLSLVAGCSPTPLWEVTVLNSYEEPIVLQGEGRRSTPIGPQRARRNWSIKPGETLRIVAGDKVREEHVAGQPPLSFKDTEDGHILLVAGGPADLIVVDYSELYTEEGEEPVANPEIKLVEDLRGRKSVLLRRGDSLDFPYEGVKETKYHGGGFGDRRILRVVAVDPAIGDDELADFLRADLASRMAENKEDG